MRRILISKNAFPRSFLRYFSSTPTGNAQNKLVRLTIDGIKLQVPQGTLLADAIKLAGIDIPTMCYHSDLKKSGGICRICLVDDISRSETAPPIISCRTPVQENMNIATRSSRLVQLRATNENLMLRTHPSTCLTCPSNTKCETQNISAKLNNHAKDSKKMMYEPAYNQTVDTNTVINRNMNLCIGCDRCIQACDTQCKVYNWENKEYHAVESFGPMKNSTCIQCGQCINRCPTGALTEGTEIDEVTKALADPEKHVVFQIAPAIRASIAEEFGFKPGERTLKKELVTALKKLGKNVTVLDTDFGADQTIMEEAAEFIERVSRLALNKPYLSKEKEYNLTLPMFTSCCPGWVTYVEKAYPDMISHLSSCKSPMQMQSALIKTYWAEKVMKIDPKKIVNVAIMPCTAKKMEKERPSMRTKEFKYTDYILTTREAARIFKENGLDPAKLPGTDFDKVMGISTGAGVIFGATGGVLEAALRTAYEILTGRSVPFKNLNILPIRGMDGVREAEFVLTDLKPEFKGLEGFKVKVAVAHQIINAQKLLEKVKEAKQKGEPVPWHLIEVMACPGGCLGGGGQPKPTSLEIRQERAKLIYKEDMDLPLRKSHENPEIKDMYKNFLGYPLSHIAHELLHTYYTPFDGQYYKLFEDKDPSGVDEILAKYPKKEQQYLLPMVIDITDLKGSISVAHMKKVADHISIPISKVNSILSNYHYFPKSETQDKKPHLYFCMCHSCLMRGQKENLQTVLHSPPYSSQYHIKTMNWLGVCVNDAPAIMVKRPGNNLVEYLFGVNSKNLSDKLFKKFNQNITSMIPDNFELYKFSRMNNSPPSLLDTTSDITAACSYAITAKASDILKKLENAKLQGRGGAGFPTFKKWEAVRNIENANKFVVCNADEGLPSTVKDYYILKDENTRMKTIAGMGICMNLVKAKKGYIYLRYEYRNLKHDIEKTIIQFKNSNQQYSNIDIQVRIGGGPYVAGEETAQFESIQGNAPLPRKDRPYNVFATNCGVFNSPTVINNVETFCAVPYILEHSEMSIKKNGLPKLFNVVGDVKKPIIMEYALNTNEDVTLNRILGELNLTDIVAAEVGGNTEPIIKRDMFNTKIGFEQGALNAVGSIVLFNNKRDLQDIYLNKMDFMVHESCKQCVPCREGGVVLRDAIKALKHGEVCKNSIKVLKQVAESAGCSSICAHGKALPGLFNAAVKEMEKNGKQ